jgi:hypothetical protein
MIRGPGPLSTPVPKGSLILYRERDHLVWFPADSGGHVVEDMETVLCNLVRPAWVWRRKRHAKRKTTATPKVSCARDPKAPLYLSKAPEWPYAFDFLSKPEVLAEDLGKDEDWARKVLCGDTETLSEIAFPRDVEWKEGI